MESRQIEKLTEPLYAPPPPPSPRRKLRGCSWPALLEAAGGMKRRQPLQCRFIMGELYSMYATHFPRWDPRTRLESLLSAQRGLLRIS